MHRARCRAGAGRLPSRSGRSGRDRRGLVVRTRRRVVLVVVAVVLVVVDEAQLDHRLAEHRHAARPFRVRRLSRRCSRATTDRSRWPDRLDPAPKTALPTARSSHPRRSRPRSRHSFPSTARAGRAASAKLAQRREERPRIADGGRHRHEPVDGEARPPRSASTSPAASSGATPALLRLAAPRSPARARGRPARGERSRRRARRGRPNASSDTTARALAPCCAAVGR